MDRQLMLYLLLFAVCIAVELSIKISTENILRKIAIGFIAVGALVEYSGSNSTFIEIGTLIFMLTSLFTAYLTNPKRRSADNDTHT